MIDPIEDLLKSPVSKVRFMKSVDEAVSARN